MRYKFIPHKLIKSREDIAKKHVIDKDVEPIFEDEEVKKLVFRFAQMNPHKVKMYAETLSNTEIKQIVSYIPHNIYHVELNNLFKVYEQKASFDNAELLYKNWQDSYENEQCNEYLGEMIKRDECFQELLKEYKINVNQFSDVITNGEPISYFTSIILEEKAHNTIILDDLAVEYGIKQESRLFYQIKYLFFTFCNKEEYLNKDKEELLGIVKKYANSSKKDLFAFVKNFLSELSLRELEKYEDLARYLITRIGDKGTQSFEAFFNDDPIVSKYVNWINIILLNDIFGNDERSNFWKQFKFDNITRYRRSNCVVLSMNGYSAIEFLGKGMGPAYFCHNDIYKEKIKKYVALDGFTTLKSDLLSAFKRNQDQVCSDGKPAIIRHEHRGDWETLFFFLIMKQNMSEKI